ncbi:MAG TPA: MarC family protein [Ignavibacteria bacterium]|jgi:multiple antibiotic resistance protein
MEHFLQAIPMAFLALFPLVNPVGAIPLFCTLTSDGTNEYRKKMAFKTSLNVVIILIVFLLIGKLLLEFFGISLPVLKIAGGLIVAHTAWEMVTSKNKLTKEESSELDDKEDISFTPMAMPMLSGPGSIGIVIGLTSANSVSSISYYLGFSVGIILLGIIVYILLIISLRLFKLLGTTGIGVMSRIMGFFILAIAVEIIYQGLLGLK